MPKKSIIKFILFVFASIVLLSSYVSAIQHDYVVLPLPAQTSEGKDLNTYPKIKVLTTSYFAHQWSDQGAYCKVSKNGKRLGNFVALNFLPSGSIVMIPSLLKTTKLEVADTLKGRGIGYFRNKKYWKVDILRDEKEWLDDFDRPQELHVVKINKKGKFRDKMVRENHQAFLQSIK